MKPPRLYHSLGITLLLSLLLPASVEAKDKQKVKARIHFVAKGEIKFSYGGWEVEYTDHAEDANTISGITDYHSFTVGKILFLRMRSPFVYRHFTVAMEAKEGIHSIPVRLEDIRYLGTNPDISDVTLKELKDMKLPIEADTADLRMRDLWDQRGLSKNARSESAWITLPSKGEWHTYAIPITSELLGE